MHAGRPSCANIDQTFAALTCTSPSLPTSNALFTCIKSKIHSSNSNRNCNAAKKSAEMSLSFQSKRNSWRTRKASRGGRSERRVIQKVVPLRAAAATAATLDTVGRRELEENIEKKE